MKKLSFFIGFIILSINAYSQQPYVQKLANIAEITLPDTPRVVDREGTIYIFKDAAANIYMAQTSKLNKNFGDYLNRHLADSIYDGFIIGVTSSSGAYVFYRKNIDLQGLHGVDFDYKITTKGSSYWCYHHVFYVNDIVVSYAYWSTDSLANNDKKIQNYFSTFKLLIKPSQISDNSSELAYKVGNVIGKVLAVLSILGVIGLIVFLIIRSTRKKPIDPNDYIGP